MKISANVGIKHSLIYPYSFCSQAELEPGPRKLANQMLLSISPDKALENLQKIYSTYYGGLSTPSGQRKGSFSFLKKKTSSSTSISSKAPVIEVILSNVLLMSNLSVFKNVDLNR